MYLHEFTEKLHIKKNKQTNLKTHCEMEKNQKKIDLSLEKMNATDSSSEIKPSA